VTNHQPISLRTFLIIWAGQFASILGSQMTSFAVTIWAWELTERATPLSLIIFFTRVPTVIAATFAGILVDRWNRKWLMLAGDAIAGLSTIVILLLWWTQSLEIWHLYVTSAVNSFFGYFQGLAYSASMSMIVPKQHYMRATAMDSYLTPFGSDILAPALAATLYAIGGLSSVLTVDLVTFMIAVLTLLTVYIPQPSRNEADAGETEQMGDRPLWRELTFGFRYLLQQPSLLALLGYLMASVLVSTMTSPIYAPMILARSGNDAGVLASVQSAAGMGGVVGAVVLSSWGGSKRRIHGLLLGNALAYGNEVILGLLRSPVVWLPVSFLGAFFSPFVGSSNQAIWLAKVKPDVQGRVFATRFLIAQIIAPLGLIISGPLADRVFEPAMMPDGALAGLLGGLFGTGTGAGMALQYSLICFLGVLIGLGGYGFRPLRDVETIVPDHDAPKSCR
jgi:DHA3 family macrolide efflux protein-like MFS transporter